VKKFLIQKVYDQNSIVDLERDVSEMFVGVEGVPEEYEIEVLIRFHTDEVIKILPETAHILDELEEAIRNFGEYTFTDKGPTEVMDIDSIVSRLRARSPEIVATVISQLMEDDDIFANTLGEFLAEELQDWDDLWAVPLMQEIFHE